MKRFTISAVGLACISLLAVGTATGGITGSAHDFTGKSWNPTGEICAPCHTPHNADTSVTDAPLWDHELTTTTFGLYSSSTLDATIGQPAGNSKLCLSCHDGTVAMDNFGGTIGGTNFIGGSKDLGTNLGDDHPIGITFNTALSTTDTGLFDPATTASGLAGGGTITADLLFSSQMECASCHDVHDKDGNAKLLRVNNAGSALCLTCHNK